MDFIALAIAKKYVDDTANALGSLKGATATIKSITPVEGGNNVVFEWTGTDGTKQTQTMFVKNGKDGTDGVSPTISVEKISGGNRVTITDKDGTKSFTVKDGTGSGSGGGSGGVSSWNDLTDKPFYKESNQTVIEWDGNTEGRTAIGSFYKVSDVPYTDLVGCKVILKLDDELAAEVGAPAIQETTITGSGTDGILGYTAQLDMGTDGTMNQSIICVITEDDASFETGTYFVSSMFYYVSSLTVSTETIKTIDPEFLPLLTSPNGTKYKLTVADDGTLSAVVVS